MVPRNSRVQTLVRDSEGCASSLCRFDPSAVGVWPAGPAAATVTLACTCGSRKRSDTLEICQKLLYGQYECIVKTKPLKKKRRWMLSYCTDQRSPQNDLLL